MNHYIIHFIRNLNSDDQEIIEKKKKMSHKLMEIQILG
jgi:hypothetical protein